MDATELYNLTPTATLMVIAGALACLPAVWVVHRHRGEPPYRWRIALTALTLFLTFDLILVGAFTRLTDSGLGCPDWPGCYGSSSPIGAHSHIQNAQLAMPSGPVTHQKAWIEMAHRYLASGVGALIFLQAAIAWKDHWSATKSATGLASMHFRTIGPWLPTLTLFWVCVQGAFGALTVTMKLFPAIVSLHLLGAYGLLALLVIQWTKWVQVTERNANSSHGATPPSVLTVTPSKNKLILAVALLMLLVQSSSGAWVSTNYAVLVCGEFPKCQGMWWPPMDFSAAFEIWRPLGEHADGRTISFQALTAIQVLHRMLAILTVIVLFGVAVTLRRQSGIKKILRYLMAVLALQIVTGLSNVVLDWPIAAAMLHTGGAGALVALLVWLLVHPGIKRHE